ncbi:MAG: DUF2851 family protein [Chryseolinea sp.]
MTESFLHYLWQFQYFNKAAFVTTTGDEICVYNPGQRNRDAGPDFFNARLRIGPIEWFGSVEIHIYASGWVEHHHNTDAAYDNVVLHVVWKDDKAVSRADGSAMPTFELQHRVDESLLFQYKRLLHNPEAIPCAASFNDVNNICKLSMLDKVLAERLEVKANIILKMLLRNNNDWEETCYQTIFKNFGFKVNADPFHQLSQSISYKFLLKHADQINQVEALLFGQAGFLEEKNEEDYYRMLQREYKLLGQKYQLTSKKVNRIQWRFLRLRPANFPTIRIAQFAALIFHRRNLLSSILSQGSCKSLQLFFSIRQSPYWMHHYHFFRPIKDEIDTLGEAAVNNLIINSVVPLMVAYGKSKDDQGYVDKAVRILQTLHAETNMITKQWKTLGIASRTAFDSQALVQLYNNYCLKRRCLECNIGASIVNPRNR